jgi:hypothetical protein
LKTEQIICLEMSIRHYQFMLHDTSQESKCCIMIWWCRPWFDSAQSNSEQSDSTHHTQI